MIGPESRQRRRATIEDILRREAIHSQSDLVARLHQGGFQVTQSSVSRDLREIGATRVDGCYLTMEMLAAGEARASGLEEVAAFVVEISEAGPHLLIVKTPPGIASMVALGLDRAGWSEVVGTVAGDDTFFIATKGRRQQARVKARLRQLARVSHQVS
jgi:transcriptional regulator of arginine metabolism